MKLENRQLTKRYFKLIIFAWLQLQTIIPARAGSLPPHARGVRIQEIERGGVFDRLGLKNGDLVTAINDRPTTDEGSAKQLFELLSHPTTDLTLDVTRDGKSLKLIYRLKH